MRKFLVGLLACVAITLPVLAETDSRALKEIDAIRKGRNTKDQIVDLRVQDDATIGDDLAVGGNSAVTGDETVGGNSVVTGSHTVGGRLSVTGTATLPLLYTIDVTDVAYTCSVSTVAGKLLLLNTNAAMAIVLPTNAIAAGTWFDMAIIGTDACDPTISALVADTLITTNSTDSDSVTWATGHRIGAYARFWSDGSFWHVLNLGGTTMTYTDSD